MIRFLFPLGENAMSYFCYDARRPSLLLSSASMSVLAVNVEGIFFMMIWYRMFQ